MATKLSKKDEAICNSILKKGWHVAIQKNIKNNENIRGMIIGDTGYIKHIISHLDEEYTIITNKNSSNG